MKSALTAPWIRSSCNRKENTFQLKYILGKDVEIYIYIYMHVKELCSRITYIQVAHICHVR